MYYVQAYVHDLHIIQSFYIRQAINLDIKISFNDGLKRIRNVVWSLPTENYNTLRHVCAFLNEVSACFHSLVYLPKTVLA